MAQRVGVAAPPFIAGVDVGYVVYDQVHPGQCGSNQLPFSKDTALSQESSDGLYTQKIEGNL